MILAVNKRDSLLIRPGDLGVKPKQGPSFCCPSEIRLEIERVRRDSPHDLLLGMSLDPFALLLSQLLDLAAHDTECSAQDRGKPLVKVAFAGVPDHDQFVLWRNRNVNTHPKRIPVSLMFLRLLDGHVTPNEVITDAFELCSLLVDERFNV